MGYQDRHDGASMRHFAAWAALRNHLEEAVIIMEESDRFDQDLLAKVFAKKYIIHAQVVSSLHFGWPVKRNRLWAFLIHKQLVTTTFCSL